MVKRRCRFSPTSCDHGVPDGFYIPYKTVEQVHIHTGSHTDCFIRTTHFEPNNLRSREVLLKYKEFYFVHITNIDPSKQNPFIIHAQLIPHIVGL